MYKRLFIAIKINPTEELLRRIYFLKSNLKHELINWIRDDHYHLTLKFLGKVAESRIGQISEVISKVVAKNEKHSFSIGQIGIFGSQYNPRVLWIGVDEQERINQLHDEIAAGLNEIGFPDDGQNFIPHISLARIKKLTDKSFFQRIIDKSDLEFNHHQILEEIILFESVLGSIGAEYKVIEKFELKAKR